LSLLVREFYVVKFLLVVVSDVDDIVCFEPFEGGVEVSDDAFCWEYEFAAEELGKERDLVEEYAIGDALVRNAAALLDPCVHCCGDDGFGDEEVDYHVTVETKLKAIS
jgi:hypothetical protein